jgi:hypothetical protein
MIFGWPLTTGDADPSQRHLACAPERKALLAARGCSTFKSLRAAKDSRMTLLPTAASSGGMLVV